MTDKERLEELHKFYINGIINVDDLVRELVKLEQLNWALINQNKRYREALEEIMRTETVTIALAEDQVAYTFSGHIARQALEESK